MSLTDSSPSSTADSASSVSTQLPYGTLCCIGLKICYL
ncbi:hypothetical protein BN903_24 [Halorubrum sp. AJ67]|nr:hypothetical protein BN903_24 [Halorubrum sp. AJ67]